MRSYVVHPPTQEHIDFEIYTSSPPNWGNLAKSEWADMLGAMANINNTNNNNNNNNNDNSNNGDDEDADEDMEDEGIYLSEYDLASLREANALLCRRKCHTLENRYLIDAGSGAVHMMGHKYA